MRWMTQASDLIRLSAQAQATGLHWAWVQGLVPERVRVLDKVLVLGRGLVREQVLDKGQAQAKGLVPEQDRGLVPGPRRR